MEESHTETGGPNEKTGESYEDSFLYEENEEDMNDEQFESIVDPEKTTKKSVFKKRGVFPSSSLRSKNNNLLLNEEVELKKRFLTTRHQVNNNESFLNSQNNNSFLSKERQKALEEVALLYKSNESEVNYDLKANSLEEYHDFIPPSPSQSPLRSPSRISAHSPSHPLTFSPARSPRKHSPYRGEGKACTPEDKRDSVSSDRNSTSDDLNSVHFETSSAHSSIDSYNDYPFLGESNFDDNQPEFNQNNNNNNNNNIINNNNNNNQEDSSPKKISRGWLVKRGGSWKSWKKRWFVLNDKEIRYFTNKTETNLKGIIKISDIKEVKKSTEITSGFHFEVVTERRTYLIRAENDSARTTWIDRISSRLINNSTSLRNTSLPIAIDTSQKELSKSGSMSVSSTPNLSPVPQSPSQAIFTISSSPLMPPSSPFSSSFQASFEKDKIINLRNKKYEKLDNKLTNFEAAVEIDLSLNFLTELPLQFFMICGSLKNLNLNSNNFSQIQPSVSKLEQLRSLQMINNKLKDLPDELFKLTNLTKLSLGTIQEVYIENTVGLHNSNSISSLSPFIGQLVNLKVLDLSFNHLKKLPSEMRNLIKLTHLNLSCNKLKEFPYWFQFFSDLRDLDISSNQIETIPSIICRMRNLRKIDLRLNKLTKISFLFAKLKKLEELNLKGNSILSHFESLDCYKNFEGNNHSAKLFEALKYFETQNYVDHYYRILILGTQGSGKSTLFNSIISNNLITSTPQYFKLFKSPPVHIEEWRYKGCEMIFQGVDFSTRVLENRLHHFYFSSNTRSYLIYFTFNMNNFDKEESEIEMNLTALKSLYNNLSVILIGTHKDKITNERIKQISDQITIKFSTELITVKASNYSKKLAELTVNTARKIGGKKLPSLFRIIKNAISTDIEYFSELPIFSWRSWMNFLRYCGCETLSEADTVTRYLNECGQIVTLHSQEKDWILLSTTWIYKFLFAHSASLLNENISEYDNWGPSFPEDLVACLNNCIDSWLINFRKYVC